MVWRELDRAVSDLGPAIVGVTLAAHILSLNAGQQREASLYQSAVGTVRQSSVGDGTWVGWIGPDDAELLIVVVPGVGTDIGDRSSLAAIAERVWRHVNVVADRCGTGVRTAVAPWLGYDPPDGLLAGIRRSPARDGAELLARDVNGWRDVHDRRIVVVGHSYGATVVTLAASMGMIADEVVLLGAPGLGVESMEDMQFALGADIWSASANGDLVSASARLAPVHGPDPASVARPLPTSMDGHGAYLRDPVLLDALALVALHAVDGAGTVATDCPAPRQADDHLEPRE